MSEYTKGGGEWLGAARSWIQRRCRNGEYVTWGSGDVLEPYINVRQAEDLAACVADAANHEADEMKADLEKIRKEYLANQIIVGGRNDRMARLLNEWLDTDGHTNTSDLQERTKKELKLSSNPSVTTCGAMDELESGNGKSFPNIKGLMEDLNDE